MQLCGVWLHVLAGELVQFIFIEASFEAQEQSVITASGIVDGFQIDQESVYHAADFDELLPIATVASKA